MDGEGHGVDAKGHGGGRRIVPDISAIARFFWVLESPPRVPIIIRILHIIIYIYIPGAPKLQKKTENLGFRLKASGIDFQAILDPYLTRT